MTMAGAKGRCDACGKEVGVASLYKRIGFTPGSRLNAVCGTCFKDKLNRDERLRFAKAPAAKKKAAEEPDAWAGAERAPDELRFGG